MSSGPDRFRFPARFLVRDAKRPVDSPGTSKTRGDGNMIRNHAAVENHTRRIPGKLRLVNADNQV